MNNLTPDPASGGVMPTPEAVLYGPEELALIRARVVEAGEITSAEADALILEANRRSGIGWTHEDGTYVCPNDYPLKDEARARAEADPFGRPFPHHLVMAAFDALEATPHPAERYLAILCPDCLQVMADYLNRRPHGTFCPQCRTAWDHLEAERGAA